ncbi:MAG TPA: diguanylate cyclase [Burkholderiales bacterium]|nr:diguanylate cyclase [Burkholderiales bacterium]
MKIFRTNGTANARMSAHPGTPDLAGTARDGGGDSADCRLPQVRATLGEFERALASAREESRVMRAQLDEYVDTISRLRLKVVRLEQELEEVRHFAHHDALTGLPNRTLLLDRLDQAITQATRQHQCVGLLMLELDGFRDVNAKRGHATGDKLLQQVAQRLLSCIRSADTACRYGGDEFVVLLRDLDSAKGAAEAAQKLGSILSRPYEIDNHPISVSASIGVVVSPRDGMDPHELVRRADIAMYLAKTRDRPIGSADSAAVCQTL